MSTTTLASGFTQAAFEAFVASRDEPGWLIDLRREAWSAFIEMDFPARSEEEWMRTDIRLFKLDRFGPPRDLAAGATAPAPLLSQGVELAGQTISLDGRHLESRLDENLAQRGVLFGSLDALVASHGDLLRPHLFGQAARARVDKFAALHAACWTGSSLLYVPRGVRIEQPLHILSALGDAPTNGVDARHQVDLGHQLIVLEDGAEATVLAETAGGAESVSSETSSRQPATRQPASSGLHCGAIELLVGKNASLRYVNLQNWGTGVWHFAQQQAILDRNAHLQWTIGALGSRLAKVNQHVTLAGEGATAEVNGVMFTEGKQHLSYHTRQHHQQPHCKSDLLYKGALQDHSRIVWRGMIKVDRGAQKTNAYQRDDNLILSQGARADSIPGLEIEADDVICTHGATAGRVDDQQIFYARSRGLTRKEAVRMIVAGFFQQVFDRITIESVREALGEAIGRRIREYD